MLALASPAVLASVRGVPKAEWAIYTADTFECKDGSAKLPVSQVNDDYCDCADGSDEPGTSACPNANFFCANKGYKSKIVFSSLVNDGVCDCCDGSDEWAMGPDACKNECLELGAVAKAEAEERAKLVKSGYEIATQWAARGEESQKTTQAELDALMLEIEAKKKELAEIDERKAAAEEVEKTLQEEHRLKKEAERLEKEAEAEEQRLKEEEEKAAAAKEAAEKAPAPELDPAPSAEGDDKASAAQAQALEALGCTPLTTANCEQEDYKPVCASTKQGEEWTRRTFHSACHARAAGFSGVCFRFLTTGSCDEAPYPDLPAAEEAGEPSEDDFKAAETETEGDETAGEVEEEPEAAAEPEEPLPTDPGASARWWGEHVQRGSGLHWVVRVWVGEGPPPHPPSRPSLAAPVSHHGSMLTSVLMWLWHRRRWGGRAIAEAAGGGWQHHLVVSITDEEAGGLAGVVGQEQIKGARQRLRVPRWE